MYRLFFNNEPIISFVLFGVINTFFFLVTENMAVQNKKMKDFPKVFYLLYTDENITKTL
jgi:hypothetical protein